mgnify:CR=1 FL=1
MDDNNLFKKDKEGFDCEKLHIRIKQFKKSGKIRYSTIIQNIPEIYELKKFLKVWKKEFSCNGFIDSNNNEFGKCVILQGDQRENLVLFFRSIPNLIPLTQIKLHGGSV